MCCLFYTQTHVNHSTIHQENLAKQSMAEAAQYRANKQNDAAKIRMISTMKENRWSSSKALRSDESQKRYTKSQLLWFRAFNAVCVTRLRNYFTLRTAKMVFIANHIRLLTQTSKVFYRSSETVTVHMCMYLHSHSHCVEVVPHLIEVVPHSSSGGLIQFQPLSGSSLAASVLTSSTYFIALPRIYLNYNHLLGSVMGTHKSNSGLLAHHNTTTDEYAAHYQLVAAGGRNSGLDESMNQVIGAYIQTHLKMVKVKKHRVKSNAVKMKVSTTDKEPKHKQRRNSLDSAPRAALAIDKVSPRRALLLKAATTAATASPQSPFDGATASQKLRRNSHDDVIPLANLSAASPADADVFPVEIKEETAQLVAAEAKEIETHITDYTVYFDPASSHGGSAEMSGVLTPVLQSAPHDVTPVGSLCLDQHNVYYEPLKNK